MQYHLHRSVFKHIFLFSICATFLFSSSALFGQDSSRKVSDVSDQNPTIFLILDSIRIPNKQTVVILDDSPNYFQMENGEAIISGRHRGKSFFHQGHVEGLERSTGWAGTLYLNFYMIGSEFSNGKIASYEVRINTDGSALIHQFVKLDNKVDVYYIAHKASENEVQEIRGYWKRD